ncbi:MAG: ABC transporter substrate-binding protein [Lachnospiraceae bacterium]|nr:ABC transporter substrate-binding protein [Lachnospiraceae bacterium]
MKKMKRIAAAFLAVLMAVSVAACGGSASTAESASQAGAESAGSTKDTLNIRIPDGMATLDPCKWTLDSDFRSIYQVYEPLYRVMDDTTEVPMLATAYEIKDDGLTYVFTLRENVSFSNGDKMTAEDVAFSIMRATESPYLSFYVDMIESAEPDNEAGTVTLHLSAPSPGLIDGLSYVMVMNKKYTEENIDETGSLGYKTCGTGPYVVKEAVQDVSVTMEANPNYWGGTAPIKNLNFRFVTDETQAMNGILAGDLNVARLTTPNWEDLKKNSAIQTEELVANHITYIIINCTKEPFTDKRVRQALMMATDREAMVEMVMDGLASPAYTVVTPLMIGATQIETKYPYDVEKAKQLLTDAGYPDGLDIEIQSLADSYFDEAATVWKEQLAEIGVRANITPLDANKLISNGMTLSYDVLTMGQTNSYDMGFINTFFATDQIPDMNMSGFSDPELDALLQDAGTDLDPESRKAKYKTILERVDEECPYIPLFNRLTCVAYSNGLNYKPQVRNDRFFEASWQ